MRTALALLIGLALGFAGGWLLFNRASPDASSNRATAADAEVLLLKNLREQNPDIDSATCATRQGTGGKQFVCTVDGPDVLAGISDYLVTIDGAKLTFKRRNRF